MKKRKLIKKLNRSIRNALKTPVYKNRYRKKSHKIKTLSDFEKFPITTSEHIKEKYPFGTLAIDLCSVVEMHTSSGTTGNPKASFLTKRDIKMSNKHLAKAWKSFGVDKNSRVQFCMSYGLFSGAYVNTYALQHIGAFVLPAGIQPINKQIKLIKDFNIDTLVATPSYYFHLADKLVEAGINPRDLPLVRGIAAGETYSEQIRKKIEDIFDIKIYDHYGLSEVHTGIAYECDCCSGLHILDDYIYAEILDENKKPVKEGQDGILVLTTLDKIASPIIRYWTNDIVTNIENSCDCGRKTFKISRIKGRADDTIFIKGVKVNTHEFRDLIIQITDNEVSPHQFKIQIKSNNTLPVIFISDNVTKDEREIIKKIREETGIRFEIKKKNKEYWNNEKLKYNIVEYE